MMKYCRTGCALGLCVSQLLAVGTFSAFTTEPPRISITQTQDALHLSWPDWATNWALEEASELRAPAPWKQVFSGNNSLQLSPAKGTNGFFRLRKLSQNVAGLNGHWQFDSGEGSAPDAPDGPAVAYTNASFGTGRAGPRALQFNGGSAIGAGTRAWVSNSNFRVLPSGGRAFSVSMWFSPDALPIGTQGLMGNAGGWSVVLETPSTGTNNIIFSSASFNVSARTLLTPREWHELTLAYDGSHGHIYLDGSLLARGAGGVTTTEQPIFFGGGVGNHNSFLGRIDEVRTYTNALTAEQVSVTGHWALEETAGTVVHDSSIYSHHGTAAAIVSARGKVGNALRLSSNAITIPNDDFMVVPPSGSPFSLSFWIRPDSLPAGGIGLMSSGDGISANWELAIEVTGSETALALKSTAGNGTLNMRAPCNLATSRWAKVDVTHNGAVATIYVDGRKIHDDSGIIQSSRAPLRIGKAPGAANFDGLIDELKIYRRERGDFEIGPIATTMWESVFRGSRTNFTLKGSGPPGKALTYTILDTLTNGSLAHAGGAPVITYQAGMRKGPDALLFTVSDGEFTSVPATLNLSVVEPHWLSPRGGTVQPLDGSSAERAWPVASAAALDAIWQANNYYDCFFYAPGVYETSGAKFWMRSTAFPGCKHIGSGSEGATATTLKLVGAWEATGEETIFNHFLSPYIDGFEVHNLVLDCNGDDNPKYKWGEPVWIRLPLTATTLVHSVTIRWNVQTIPGVGVGVPWQLGAAREFKVCTRLSGENGYTTNCVTVLSTGGVDVVRLNALTDEVIVQLERRGGGIEYYSIAEIEVAGGVVSLPTATHSGGVESRLDLSDPAYSVLRIVDQNPGTAWASGPETNAQITIPVNPSAYIDALVLHWNCRTLGGTLQLGAAAQYSIRARRIDTGAYETVLFTRELRTPEGIETNKFSQRIRTDELIVELTTREPDVDMYSLREATVQDLGWPVPLRVPSALNALWSGDYSVLQAVDGAPQTAWACGTQGMIGAINVVGNNLKFTRLKVVGFGTKAGRECFALFVFNPQMNRTVGNIVIEDCLFTEPATNNAPAEGITCVSLLGNGGSITNGSVRRCTVRNLWPHFLYGAHAFRASVLEQCVVENCEQGVYFEPDFFVDDIGSVMIRSNRFLNVVSGVLFRFHRARQFGPITCEANEIALMPGRLGSGFVAMSLDNRGTSALITNATVLRNVIRYSDWLPRPGNSENGIYHSDIQNAIFANNVVTLGTSSSLRVQQCPLGQPFVPPIRERCPPHLPEQSPGEDAPPCIDILPPGYRRAWLNNRDLSGNLINVRFYYYGVDGLATQQQPPAEVP